MILEDARLRDVSRANVAGILTHTYWWPRVETRLYRPITTLSYLVNYSVLGNRDRPAGYHAVNLLLHAANTWLLFGLGWRIGGRFWPAVTIAALWAVHPLATEAVTNIVGRADLLAALGVLGALFAHVHARESSGIRRRAWLAAVMVATTVGVFSKESAVAVVGVIVLYDLLWRDARTPAGDLARGWLHLAPPLLAFVVARSIVFGPVQPQDFPFVDNPISAASFWHGRLTAVAVIARYLGRFIWPLHLSADYSFQQIPLSTGTAGDWIAWTLVALLAAGSVAMIRVNRIAFFCLAAAFATFLPASNLLFASGTIMAERLMYLPSAFLVALIVMAVYALERYVRAPWLAAATLCVIAVLCGSRTFARNRDWQDELTLWRSTVRTSPLSFKSHDALAEALYNADGTHANLAEVVAEKEQSLLLLQQVPDPAALSKPYREAATYYLEYGEWLQKQNGEGAPTKSAAAYQRAVSLAERYLALVAIHPASLKDETDARLILSTAYDRLSNRDQAIEAARRALTLDPFNPTMYRATASALIGAGHVDEAGITLMTGFMVTGQTDLRSALVDLYRSGLDQAGCAVTSTGNGVVLNSSCAIVRRHLCAAAAEGMRLQRAAGRADLAAQIEATTSGADCVSRQP